MDSLNKKLNTIKNLANDKLNKISNNGLVPVVCIGQWDNPNEITIWVDVMEDKEAGDRKLKQFDLVGAASSPFENLEDALDDLIWTLSLPHVGTRLEEK